MSSFMRLKCPKCGKITTKRGQTLANLDYYRGKTICSCDEEFSNYDNCIEILEGKKAEEYEKELEKSKL